MKVKAMTDTHKLPLHSGILRKVEGLQSICYSLFFAMNKIQLCQRKYLKFSTPKAFMILLMYSFPLIKNIFIYIQHFRGNESSTDTFPKTNKTLRKFC